MHVSLETLHFVCDEQSVELIQDVYDAEDDRLNTLHSPTEMLKAVTRVGGLLSLDARHSLASKPLALTPELAVDPAAVAIATMTQDSKAPYAGSDAFKIPRVSPLVIDTCSYAEPSFAKTILRLEAPEKSEDELGAQIVTDEQHEPAFLRKRNGESSALALRDIAIQGIRYQAGSIVRLDLRGDRLANFGAQVPILPGAVTTVVPASKIHSARFMRMSAFCYEPADREVFAPDRRSTTPLGIEAADYVQATPLAVIQETVREIADQRRLSAAS